MSIHFVTVVLTRGVHVQALGFTRNLYCYGWGTTPAEAAGNVCAYLMGGSVVVQVDRVISSRPTQGRAGVEGLRSLTLPEVVYGLPQALLEAEINARRFPAPIASTALEKAETIRHQVAAGHARHAEAIEKLTSFIGRNCP